MLAPIITLTTDFGLNDYFVGSVKGVLLSQAPRVRLVDITHNISPQDIVSAAFVIKEAYPYFPPGSIHLIVVDPSVGTERRKIVASLQGHFFVAPDNGILTYITQRGKARVFEVQERSFLNFSKSPTFAGRDHFAPIAASLAKGVGPGDLGTEIEDYYSLKDLIPQMQGKSAIGKIVYIDHFGNAITNLTQADLKDLTSFDDVIVNIKGKILRGLKKNYAEGEKRAGNLIINSSGHLEIFTPSQSAKEILNLNLLDPIFLERILRP